MSKKWPGGIITPVPATPTGPYENGTAPGIWTLSQQSYWQKQGLWPIAGNTPPSWAVWAGQTTNSGGTANLAMSYANLNTASNWSYWGDLNVARTLGGVGLSSTTRGVVAGGYVGGGTPYTSNIAYFSLASTGNASTFGLLSTTTGTSNGVAGVSSSTRGVIMGGSDYATNRTSNMSYITTATTGNSTFFGYLTQQVDNINQGGSSGTRGVIAGGYGDTTGTSSRIEYITIATTGNATNFGNLTSARFIPAGVSSSTRAIWAGGSSTSTIDYVTIATTGNASSFGTLTFNAGDSSGINNGLIGCVAYSSGISTNYITMATLGNGTTFGNLTLSSNGSMLAGCCGSQGGL